jgi:hypothetical protein
LSHGDQQLHRCILFCDRAQFTREGVNNTDNAQLCSEVNALGTVEKQFSASIQCKLWCGMLHNLTTGHMRVGRSVKRLLALARGHDDQDFYSLIDM